MTFHAGRGGNDYEHGESSFTPWLSGNGGQPKNLKVGEATLTPMEKKNKKWTDRKQKHPLQRVSKRWKMYIKVVKNFIDRWHSRCCNKSEKRRRKKTQRHRCQNCVASQEFTSQWCHVHKQIMSISNMLNKSIMSGKSKWTVSTVTDRMPELWQDADVLQRGEKVPSILFCTNSDQYKPFILSLNPVFVCNKCLFNTFVVVQIFQYNIQFFSNQIHGILFRLMQSVSIEKQILDEHHHRFCFVYICSRYLRELANVTNHKVTHFCYYCYSVHGLSKLCCRYSHRAAAHTEQSDKLLQQANNSVGFTRRYSLSDVSVIIFQSSSCSPSLLPLPYRPNNSGAAKSGSF